MGSGESQLGLSSDRGCAEESRARSESSNRSEFIETPRHSSSARARANDPLARFHPVHGELIIFAWAAVFWLPCRTGEAQVTSLDHERISVTVRAFAGHPCYFGWTGWRQGGSRPKSSAQTL